MLGYDSERRLRDLLVAVGDGERDLEAARTRLCAIPDFDLRGAFERADRDASASITSLEVLNFLRDNGVHHVAEGEAFELVKFFDSDGNCRLTFNEFIQLFLPCEDMVLRNVTQDRLGRRVGRFDRLPRDIEIAMTTVLEKEIDLQRRLEVLKRDLQVGYDYAHIAAFRSVDRYNSGRIDTVNLGSFLRSLGHYATEMELLAIIRRIDTDGDCEITMPEFSEFMTPIAPLPVVERVPLEFLPPPRPLSPLRPITRTEEILERSRIARSIGRTRPVVRHISPTRTVIVDEPIDPIYPLSYPRVHPLDPLPRLHPLDPLPRVHPLDPLPRALPAFDPRRLSPTRKPILRVFEEDEFVHSLKEQCNLEAELETAKINLARKGDFNIHDSFAIFDLNRDGLVDAMELRDGLGAIGCHVSLDECDIIVARYDRTGDRRLNQAEFAEALLAHDPHFNAQVARRPSNYVPRPLRPDDCFHPNTQIEHLSMWRTHIRCENAAEMLRQRLNEHPGFNAYEAFNSLDLNCDGALSSEELRRIIESRGYFVGLKECDQVIKKMDKNRNHRVSFAEFSHETRNKSPVRR